jgi:hypothetical protein
MKDLNAFTMESAMKMVAGTARSMGVKLPALHLLKITKGNAFGWLHFVEPIKICVMAKRPNKRKRP